MSNTSSALAIIGAVVGSYFGPPGTQWACVAAAGIGGDISTQDAPAVTTAAHLLQGSDDDTREGNGNEHS